MKKKMLGFIAFAAIAIVAGWNYNQNLNKIDDVELSDLVLENVEALANDELKPDFGTWYVYMDWVGGMNGFVQRVCTQGGASVC